VNFNEINFGNIKGDAKTKKNTNLVEKRIHNFNMILDLNSEGISQVLYYQGIRERVFMNILYNEIDKGDTCIDLGSNIGYTTLFMCERVGDSGKIYAVEPDPYNVNLLKLNLEKNNFLERSEIIPAAISDVTGKIKFWTSSKSNLSSVQKTKHSEKSIDVDCFSLNDFLQSRKYPNFIKMDIEGHEVKVFEGGLDYFTNNRGKTKILLEVHPQFYDAENDFEKILKEYFKIGFTPKYVVSTPIARPEKFVSSGYQPIAEVPTDGFIRGLYGPISNEHLLEFACRENIEGNSKKIVRSFMLERLS